MKIRPSECSGPEESSRENEALLAALQPYILTGSASMTQEDLITVMTDGNAAMCLGGNWIATTMLDGIATYTGDPSLAVAALPPFNAPGEQVWISVSPGSMWPFGKLQQWLFWSRIKYSL